MNIIGFARIIIQIAYHNEAFILIYKQKQYGISKN